MKTPTKRTETKKLDRAFAKYIVLRDKCCITCGSTQHLQCSHFFGRVARGTRWDEKNCSAQCAGCHLYFHNRSPMPYARALIERIGDEEFQRLEWKSNKPLKISTQEIIDLRKAYEAKAKKLERS